MSGQFMAGRALATVNLAEGSELLTRPQAVARRVAGPGAEPASWIVRLLGARHIGQGALLLAFPRRKVLAAAAVIDLVHAASMVLLAAVEPRFGPAARASAAAATASAVVAAAIARAGDGGRG